MNKNGKPRRKDWETNESYNRRVWFVKAYSKIDKKDLKEAVRLANIWVNILLLHCRYPDKLEQKIYAIVKSGNGGVKNK